MAKNECGLTNHQWFAIRWPMRRMVEMAVPSGVARELLRVILENTIGMKHYHVYASNDDLMNGWVTQGGHYIFGVKCKPSTFWRAKSLLINSGFIVVDGQRQIIINLPGIVKGICALHTDDAPEWVVDIASATDAIDCIYKKQYDWKETEVVGLANVMDQIKEALEKSAEARERKTKRRLAAGPNLSPSQALAHFKDLAKEYGRSYVDSAPTTGRLMGSVKNYFKYCDREQLDPLAHMRLVIQVWGKIHAAQLRKEDGKPLYLPEPVSFYAYWNAHSVIDPFIINSKFGIEDVAEKFSFDALPELEV